MIIDGKAIAKKIEDQLKAAIAKLEGRPPTLSFIIVGKEPASVSYIRMKKKKCKEVGIRSLDIELDHDVSESTLLSEIYALNHNETVDGILVQLPLPSQINSHTILEAIDPKKDVDGFHPLNMGKLLLGEHSGFFPCTPHGVMILLKHAGIELNGKHVVILGRSNIVGKPLAALLMQKLDGANATVTVCHTATENLKEICLSADVLVAAIGKPNFVTQDIVKDGAIVIDVGISRTEEGLVGDVDFSSVSLKCSRITPVPGGVGPMTIAMLLSNTLLSYQRAKK